MLSTTCSPLCLGSFCQVQAEWLRMENTKAEAGAESGGHNLRFLGHRGRVLPMRWPSIIHLVVVCLVMAGRCTCSASEVPSFRLHGCYASSSNSIWTEYGLEHALENVALAHSLSVQQTHEFGQQRCAAQDNHSPVLQASSPPPLSTWSLGSFTMSTLPHIGSLTNRDLSSFQHSCARVQVHCASLSASHVYHLQDQHLLCTCLRYELTLGFQHNSELPRPNPEECASQYFNLPADDVRRFDGPLKPIEHLYLINESIVAMTGFRSVSIDWHPCGSDEPSTPQHNVPHYSVNFFYACEQVCRISGLGIEQSVALEIEN